MKHKYLIESLIVALITLGSGVGAGFGWANYSSTHGEIEEHTNTLNVAIKQKETLEKKKNSTYTQEGTTDYENYQSYLATIQVEQAKVDELEPLQHAYISGMAWPFSIITLLSIGALIGIQDMRTSEKNKEREER